MVRLLGQIETLIYMRITLWRLGGEDTSKTIVFLVREVELLNCSCFKLELREGFSA